MGKHKRGQTPKLDFNSLGKGGKLLFAQHKIADHSFGNKRTNKRKVKTTTTRDEKRG